MFYCFRINLVFWFFGWCHLGCWVGAAVFLGVVMLTKLLCKPFRAALMVYLTRNCLKMFEACKSRGTRKTTKMKH